jgi:hypothetical protein
MGLAIGPTARTPRQLTSSKQEINAAAAEAVGCDHHTVRRYVKLREAGNPPGERAKRCRPIDEFLPKIEELVERSNGRVRADVVHERRWRRVRGRGAHDPADGRGGEGRPPVRASADVPAVGARARAVVAVGLGHGPKIRGRQATLWCGWLAWSRFRVVLPVFDKTLPTVIGCLDATLRRLVVFRRTR